MSSTTTTSGTPISHKIIGIISSRHVSVCIQRLRAGIVPTAWRAHGRVFGSRMKKSAAAARQAMANAN
jgi:hypothetical protein